MSRLTLLAAVLAFMAAHSPAQTQPATAASTQPNEIVGVLGPGAVPEDEASLHCIGLRLPIRGDANRNATVNVAYQEADAQPQDWRPAMPLFRVEGEALEDRRPAEGVALFAGSVFGLKPGTKYRVRLTLADPDGGSGEVLVERTTWAEPQPPAPKRTLHVAPGSGGGSGRQDDPLLGLAEAAKAAQPGDLLLLAPGVYAGPLSPANGGAPEAPIVFRGPDEGESVIEGPSGGTAVVAKGLKWIYFERLAIRNAMQAMAVDSAEHLVIRRCNITAVDKGLSDDALAHRLFIADNVIEGNRPYGAKGRQDVEDRGVELSGTGHVICHNRVSRFKDAIDTRNPWPVRDVDIHNNDCSECGDDGIELDFSEHNVRAYENRLTNCSTGISFQPSMGGPNYAVRNVLYNIVGESFKLHLTPTNRGQPGWKLGPHRTSGGVIIHNTIVKAGPAVRVWSDEGPAHYFFARNNLLVGSPAAYCIEITPPMKWADFDYDLFVNEGMKTFALWNEQKYPTIEQFREATGLETHGAVVAKFAGVFAEGVRLPTNPNVACAPEGNAPALAEGSPAVDAGAVLPNINDGFAGKAPDVGAWELGAKPPHYGPRPEQATAPASASRPAAAATMPGAASQATSRPFAGRRRNQEKAVMEQKDMLDVRGFGAVGDGQADDTAAIQQTIDKAAEVGGTVRLPAGVYACSGLKLHPRVGLAGDPTWSYRDFGGAIVRLRDPSARCLIDLTGAFGATVSGLCLDGARLGEGVHGIMIDKADYGQQEDTPRIERCKIAYFTGDGVHLGRIWCFSVRGCMIAHNGGNGIYVCGWDGFILDNWLSGNHQAGYGAYEENAAVTMTGNRIEWNQGGGIRINGGDHYNITGNYIDRSGGCGIHLTWRGNVPCRVISVTGNVIYRSGKPDWRPLEQYESSHVLCDGVCGLTLVGNSFSAGQDDGKKGQWSPSYGIVYRHLTDSVIKDNVLFHGAMGDLLIDLGQHGSGVIVSDNPGSLLKL